MPLDFPASPTNGQVYDRYKWNAANSVWDLNFPESVSLYSFEYLVVAGGGGGGYDAGGGGGAGGLLAGSFVVEPDSFTVTVGGPGAGAVSNTVTGSNGSPSVFGLVTSTGGGGGGSNTNAPNGQNGGSGGGGGFNLGAAGTGEPGPPRQGNDGGPGSSTGSGGGGGGAGGAGAQNDSNSSSSAEGSGLASDISGSSITYSAGGVGGWNVSPGNTPVDGDVNTGNGGDGGGRPASGTGPGASGGSGVVILKYPEAASLTIGVGLTSSTVTSGGYKITTFTQGSDTITVT